MPPVLKSMPLKKPVLKFVLSQGACAQVYAFWRIMCSILCLLKKHVLQSMPSNEACAQACAFSRSLCSSLCLLKTPVLHSLPCSPVHTFQRSLPVLKSMPLKKPVLKVCAFCSQVYNALWKILCSFLCFLKKPVLLQSMPPNEAYAQVYASQEACALAFQMSHILLVFYFL